MRDRTSVPSVPRPCPHAEARTEGASVPSVPPTGARHGGHGRTLPELSDRARAGGTDGNETPADRVAARGSLWNPAAAPRGWLLFELAAIFGPGCALITGPIDRPASARAAQRRGSPESAGLLISGERGKMSHRQPDRPSGSRGIAGRGAGIGSRPQHATGGPAAERPAAAEPREPGIGETAGSARTAGGPASKALHLAGEGSEAHRSSSEPTRRRDASMTAARPSATRAEITQEQHHAHD